MEQTAQTFNWTFLVIPALLTLVPVSLFVGGYRVSRRYVSSFAGKTLYWLGGHGVTLVIVAALTAMQGVFVPDMVVTQLPLLLSVAYLLLGLVLRSSYFFSLGLATPGLWMFCVKSWEAFSGIKGTIYLLPQDPFWYLLAAAIIFGLQYLSKPRLFWEEAEASLVTISGSYLMGGIWLLALGQKSLLDGIGLPQYIWAAVLFATAAFLLWCARYLRDPLFAACSVIGLAAGVYTFIIYFPWG